MQSDTSEKKDMTITLNRDKIVNAVVVVELVLLLVFGWQLYQLKQQVEGGGSDLAQAAADNSGTNPTPSQPSPTQPTGNNQPSGNTGPVDVTVTDDDHVRGNPDAPVTIVEYSDFECPFCEKAYPTVKQVMDEYADDVRLVYRHFPLSFHPQAQKAAEASECAADQGKFWEMHDTIFENQSMLSGGVSQLKTWAGELGLNQQQFDSCLDSGEKAQLVKDELSKGQQQGISGTPGFLINGQKITGAQPFSSFKQVIDAELAKN